MKMVAVPLIAAMLTPVGASASPQSDPQAVVLMAQCKVASGGGALDAPAAFHEQGKFLRDGNAGTYEEYGDLHRLRTFGIHHFSDHTDYGGFDGQVAWRQGADGVVHRITDAKSLAGVRSDAYVTVGGYFYPDRFPAIFRTLGRQLVDGQAYDVVSVTPADADSVDLWLDARTHLVARLTTSADRAAYATIFNYKSVAGTQIGFASDQVEPGHKTDLRLTSYDYTKLDPTVFSIGSRVKPK